MTYALTEHPEGGYHFDPWHGASVHVRVYPPAKMSLAERDERWPEWPKRRADLSARRRLMGAETGGER